MQRFWIHCVVTGLGLVATPLIAGGQTNAERRDRREAREERSFEQGRDREMRGWQERVMPARDLPGEVKNTLGQQGADINKASEVVKMMRGAQTIYRILVDEGTQQSVYVISDKGELLGKDNTTETGRVRVEYDQLPGEVKNTIAKEARPEIGRVTQVTRGDRTWYVAQVKDDEGMRIIRVGKNGELLDHGDLPDGVRTKLMSASPGGLRSRDRDRETEFDEPQFRGWQRAKTDQNELPGEVKNTLGQQQGQGDKVVHATKLTRGGQAHYLVEVEGANGYTRLYRIDQNGKLIDVENVTEAGRQKISYDTLPGEVKSSLAAYGQSSEMTVYSVTRGDRTFYVARTPEKTVFVGRDGKVMSENELAELRRQYRDDRQQDNRSDRRDAQDRRNRQ